VLEWEQGQVLEQEFPANQLEQGFFHLEMACFPIFSKNLFFIYIAEFFNYQFF
jgi:hypothetical protein